MSTRDPCVTELLQKCPRHHLSKGAFFFTGTAAKSLCLYVRARGRSVWQIRDCDMWSPSPRHHTCENCKHLEASGAVDFVKVFWEARVTCTLWIAACGQRCMAWTVLTVGKIVYQMPTKYLGIFKKCTVTLIMWIMFFCPEIFHHGGNTDPWESYAGCPLADNSGECSGPAVLGTVLCSKQHFASVSARPLHCGQETSARLVSSLCCRKEAEEHSAIAALAPTPRMLPVLLCHPPHGNWRAFLGCLYK